MAFINVTNLGLGWIMSSGFITFYYSVAILHRDSNVAESALAKFATCRTSSVEMPRYYYEQTFVSICIDNLWNVAGPDCMLGLAILASDTPDEGLVPKRCVL